MKNFLHCEYCGAKNHKDHLVCHACGAPVGIMEEETPIIVNPIAYPKSEPLDITVYPEWIYRPYGRTDDIDWNNVWYSGTRTICSTTYSGDTTNLTIGGSNPGIVAPSYYAPNTCTAMANSVPCTLTF